MKTCKVVRCKSVSEEGGLCGHHFARFKKTGVIDNLLTMSFEERFWSWVDRRGPDECWPWLSKSKIDGYGVITKSGSVKGGTRPVKILAHRAAWELTSGPIPDAGEYHGTVVRHRCDNPLCCNPGHLVLGRQMDNVADMDARGRRRSVNLVGEQHGNSKMTVAGVQEIRRGEISDKDAAKKYGMAPASIKQIRQGRIWKHVVTVGAKKRERVLPKGSANHASKLTEELVRDLRAGRKTTKEIAALTGASQVSIDSAKRGATWKHLI